MADGLLLLWAVVEKCGQDVKLKGGEVEHGELPADLFGEVLGSLAEIKVGDEGTHRLAPGVVGRGAGRACERAKSASGSAQNTSR